MVVGKLEGNRLRGAGEEEADVFLESFEEFVEIALALDLLVFFVELHLNF